MTNPENFVSIAENAGTCYVLNTWDFPYKKIEEDDMNDSPICVGPCFVQPDWTYQPPYKTYEWPTLPEPYVYPWTPPILPEVQTWHFYNYNGATEDEKQALSLLKEAYEKYKLLSEPSERLNNEFLDAIHKAQSVVALRVAKRNNPEIWNVG